MSATYKKKIILVLSLLFTFLLPFGALAADFVPLTNLPTDFVADGNAGSFFQSVFRYGVVVAGFLAVVMLVYGGFVYMTSEAVPSKSNAKDIIRDALAGLFLILLSVILLSVINPDILNFSLFSTPQP